MRAGDARLVIVPAVSATPSHSAAGRYLKKQKCEAPEFPLFFVNKILYHPAVQTATVSLYLFWYRGM